MRREAAISTLKESTRDRSESDPSVQATVKVPLTQAKSLPLSYHMDNRNSSSKESTQVGGQGQHPPNAEGQGRSEGHNLEEFTVISHQQVEDTTSNSSRESGLFHLTSRTSTLSYSEGEDRSASSRGSNMGDSGYLGGR